jgi:carbon monoxide dehydrogenase subunit G
MKVEFEGNLEVDASIARVWDRLMDPQFVASCAPAVEQVEVLSPERYRVTAGLGVGPVRVRFRLEVLLGDLEPPCSASLTARGKAPGSNVDLTSRVRLTSIAEEATRLSWTLESHVLGTVASVGGRLLESTARGLAEGFWHRFAERVGTEGAP